MKRTFRESLYACNATCGQNRMLTICAPALFDTKPGTHTHRLRWTQEQKPNNGPHSSQRIKRDTFLFEWKAHTLQRHHNLFTLHSFKEQILFITKKPKNFSARSFQFFLLWSFRQLSYQFYIKGCDKRCIWERRCARLNPLFALSLETNLWMNIKMEQCGAPVIKRLRALFIVALSPSLKHWKSLFHDGRWKIIKSFGYFLLILLKIDNKIPLIFQNANDECEGGKTSEWTTIITLNFTVRFVYPNTFTFILWTFNPETGSLWWKLNGIYREKFQRNPFGVRIDQ